MRYFLLLFPIVWLMDLEGLVGRMLETLNLRPWFETVLRRASDTGSIVGESSDGFSYAANNVFFSPY